MEASGHLVGPPVFNTGEVEYLGLAGSIPVRLRHTHPPATVGPSAARPDARSMRTGTAEE